MEMDPWKFVDPLGGYFGRFHTAILTLPPFSLLDVDPIAKALAFEVASRLDQLDYLHAQVLRREITLGPLESTISDEDASPFQQILQCAIYAEAFYLFAFRTLDAMRGVNKRLFGKRSICSEPVGVRDVRNHLIIHPENLPQPILNRSFQVSKEDKRGIILKSARSATERSDFVDAGYRANATEFQLYIGAWITELYKRTKQAGELP